MYMDKQVKRGYNEYIRLDEGIGKDAMMDVALLVMEDGDTWSCEEPEKEVAALVFDGKCTTKWENESYDVDRPNPFDYNPSCLHVCKGVKSVTVDGKAVEGNVLPVAENGATVNVEVVMG